MADLSDSNDSLDELFTNESVETLFQRALGDIQHCREKINLMRNTAISPPTPSGTTGGHGSLALLGDSGTKVRAQQGNAHMPYICTHALRLHICLTNEHEHMSGFSELLLGILAVKPY